MLLARAERAIALEEERAFLLTQATELEAYVSRRQQVAQAVASLRPALGAWVAFRDRRLPVAVDPAKVRSVSQACQLALSKMAVDRAWIQAPGGFNFRTFSAAVEGLKVSLEAELAVAWKAYLAQHKPATSDDLLDLLAKVASLETSVQTVRAFDRVLGAVVYPRDAKEFAKVDDQILQLKVALNTLHSNDLDEDVLAFLRSLGEDGAPLHLLTPSVMAWLKKEKLVDAFRIQVAR